MHDPRELARGHVAPEPVRAHEKNPRAQALLGKDAGARRAGAAVTQVSPGGADQLADLLDVILPHEEGADVTERRKLAGAPLVKRADAPRRPAGRPEDRPPQLHEVGARPREGVLGPLPQRERPLHPVGRELGEDLSRLATAHAVDDAEPPLAQASPVLIDLAPRAPPRGEGHLEVPRAHRASLGRDNGPAHDATSRPKTRRS